MHSALLKYFCLLFVLAANINIAQPQTDSSFQSTLTFNIVKDQLQIIPLFRNKSDKDIKIKYKFIVVKNGSNGESTTNQSGGKDVAADSNESLSEVSLDFNIKYSYEVDLTILKDNKLINEIHKIYSGKEIQDHEY